MTAPALPGMETSAAERRRTAHIYRTHARVLRLLRDFDRAFAAGRAAERAEIVAWLRRAAKAYRDLPRQARGSREGSLIDALADEIDRGAHSPDTGAA